MRVEILDKQTTVLRKDRASDRKPLEIKDFKKSIQRTLYTATADSIAASVTRCTEGTKEKRQDVNTLVQDILCDTHRELYHLIDDITWNASTSLKWGFSSRPYLDALLSIRKIFPIRKVRSASQILASRYLHKRIRRIRLGTSLYGEGWLTPPTGKWPGLRPATGRLKVDLATDSGPLRGLKQHPASY